jgi:hypothetical protein
VKPRRAAVVGRRIVDLSADQITLDSGRKLYFEADGIQITDDRGGKRPGTGRPRSTARCYCGKHTMARATLLSLKCRKP